MLQPGLIMDRPLLISDVIEHAAAQFGDSEIVSRETHGPLFRYTYAQCAARARKLAHALRYLGLRAGNAVATLAWNNHRHLEIYYAVSGSGMVIHTCNPRLHPEQLIYIVNHAEDRVLFFDRTFAPLIERIAPRCPKVKAWIGLSDATNMPALAGVDNVLCYEDCIAPHPEQFDWPQFDERGAAAICYTSGTTGHPKGALYSHRAIVLNATACCLPGVLSISPRDTILPAVPMFPVNGWCIPYAAPIGGAKLVLPGQRLDGASLYELMEAEGVTLTCLSARQMNTPAAARHAHSAKHGKSAFGIEIKVVDQNGATLPRDGVSQGELMVRGQWIIERYYKSDASAQVDGCFPTGDIATIDAHGLLHIKDRAKDLIKAGGEWISSIDLENAAVGHPAVAMAAVIGVEHPRWEERPLLFIVRKPDHTLERKEILAFLAGQVAKWWVPDEVIFLDPQPVGGTGKVQKAALRERYGSVFI
jgi:acyl-CoA synthetase (AMP-forming)/AMP-acid ligase II